MCQLTPKGATAELPRLLRPSYTLTFLLKQLEAIIFPVINVNLAVLKERFS